MPVSQFQAAVRFSVDAEDFANDMQMSKEFTFTSAAELVLFMELVEKARVDARLQHAYNTNELH